MANTKAIWKWVRTAANLIKKIRDQQCYFSNLSKGSGSNLSAIFYGNFTDLYVELFGILEILVDPFSDFNKGTTNLRVASREHIFIH